MADEQQLYLISINGHNLGSEWAITAQEARELAAQDYAEDASKLMVRCGQVKQQQDESEVQE